MSADTVCTTSAPSHSYMLAQEQDMETGDRAHKRANCENDQRFRCHLHSASLMYAFRAASLDGVIDTLSCFSGESVLVGAVGTGSYATSRVDDILWTKQWGQTCHVSLPTCLLPTNYRVRPRDLRQNALRALP